MLSTLLLAAAVLPQTQVNQPTLMVGDDAPPLAIKQWLKGSPVERFDKEHVYLVEFWATWCGPCLNGMKHLTQLQERYGKDGLVVIGVIGEDKWGNDLPNIHKVLEEHVSRIGYSVALDKPTVKGYQNVFFGQTFWNFMGAAQTQSIPSSFLIDKDGKVAFIGLPTVAEGAIKEALDGTIDVAARARAYAKYKPSEGKLDDYFALLKAGKESEAYALGRNLVKGAFRFDARMQWLIGNAIVDVLDKRQARDLELAELSLKQALDESGGTDVNMRGSWACLLFQQGKVREAQDLMQIVIQECEHPAEKDWMQKRLAIMKKGG